MSIYTRLGAASFPVAASDITDGTLWSALDPARTLLLGFFAHVIREELGAVWTATRGGPVSTASVLEGTFVAPVEPWLTRTVQFKWPLLSLYRTDSKSVERTIAEEVKVSEWVLEYALPPLDAATFVRMGAILEGVVDVVQIAIRMGYHPTFANGLHVFGENAGALATVRHGDTRRGFWTAGPQSEGQTFPMVAMMLETTERMRSNDDSQSVPFVGLEVAMTDETDTPTEPLELEVEFMAQRLVSSPARFFSEFMARLTSPSATFISTGG